MGIALFSYMEKDMVSPNTDILKVPFLTSIKVLVVAIKGQEQPEGLRISLDRLFYEVD